MVITWRGQLQYLSPGDEDAFFRWLHAIPGVQTVEGQGRELFIRLRSAKLGSGALRELIALYTRYGGNLSELAVFENSSNRQWFRDKKAYWYRAVFGKQPKQRNRRL
jgi:hypothetical protein